MIALAVIAGLIILLCVTRVGVSGGYGPGGAFLRLRIGVFRVRILPSKPKKEKKKRPPQKPEGRREKKPEKKPGKKYSFDAVMELVHIGLRYGRKFLRGLRVDLREIDITAGGKDACAAALLYGRICAALGVLLPALDGAVRLRRGRIRVTVDYSLEKPRVYGRGALSVSIGHILAVSFGAVFALARWRMKHGKQQESAQQERGKAA